MVLAAPRAAPGSLIQLQLLGAPAPPHTRVKIAMLACVLSTAKWVTGSHGPLAPRLAGSALPTDPERLQGMPQTADTSVVSPKPRWIAMTSSTALLIASWARGQPSGLMCPVPRPAAPAPSLAHALSTFTASPVVSVVPLLQIRRQKRVPATRPLARLIAQLGIGVRSTDAPLLVDRPRRIPAAVTSSTTCVMAVQLVL